LKLKIAENEVKRLRLSVEFESVSDRFEFLGYKVDLESGEISDTFRVNCQLARGEFDVLQTLLTHYCKADPVERTGRLVKFASLPGGQAYEKAFLKRAVEPIADTFGEKPEELSECAKTLGGFSKAYGDASAELSALPSIPLTIILWETNEFPAQASILFDESASHYLPTEDLAVLGELATSRLLKIHSVVR
jgi:hypothetical protein